MTRARSRSGFTLLEIMITLAILGIVLSLVYGVFSQTLAGKELAERRGEEAAGARAALARIARDLASARPVISANANPASAGTPALGSAPTPTPQATTFSPDRGLFLGRVRTESGVAIDDVAFTAMLRRPTAITFAASDLGIVHYFVDAVSPESKVLGLYRETVFSLSGGTFDPDKADPANSTLILPGVSALDFRFFDGKDWVQDWDSTDSRNFTAAPLAVAIVLSVTNDHGETETYQTAVDLPLAQTIKRPQVVARPTPS
jgi:prepilin-type N-terminal cleavage/methylation domain-containing protein